MRFSWRKSLEPFPWWEFGFPCSTVRTVLRRRTPWRAHFSKQPCFGIEKSPRSFFNSLNEFIVMTETRNCFFCIVIDTNLNMFFRLGGGVTPKGTENANPWAWPGPWYGSATTDIQFQQKKKFFWKKGRIKRSTLSNDHNFHFIKWSEIESVEDVRFFWENNCTRFFSLWCVECIDCFALCFHSNKKRNPQKVYLG